MKKIQLAMVLIFLFAFPVFAISISAADTPVGGTCGDHVYWSFDEVTETLTLSGVGPTYDYEPNMIWINPQSRGGVLQNDSDWEDRIERENAAPWYDSNQTWMKIRKIVIEDGITYIGKAIFSGLYELREVYMASSVTIIGEEAFLHAKALREVVFSDNLIEIEDCAFWMAKNLSKVDLPDTLVTLGEMAFAETALTSLKLPEAIVTVGKEAIPITVREIHIPKNLREISISAVYNRTPLFQYDHITVDPDNPYYRMEKGCLIKNEDLCIYFTQNATGIPEGVKWIAHYCFMGNTTLPAELVIPEGVSSISNGAFSDCSQIRTVEFPSTLEYLGWSVFDGCYGIESISLDPSNENYYVEGMSLIRKNDHKLVLHFAPAPIPEEVTKIDNYAIVCQDEHYEVREGIENILTGFVLGRNLKELTLPRSLRYLAAFSMVECPVLTDIYFRGTRAEWNTLTANFEEEAGREWTNEKMWFNRVTVHCIDEIEETTAGSESETGDPNVTTQPPTSSETQPPTPTGCGSTVNLPWIALVMIVPILWSRKRHRRP